MCVDEYDEDGWGSCVGRARRGVLPYLSMTPWQGLQGPRGEVRVGGKEGSQEKGVRRGLCKEECKKAVH